MSFLNSLLKSVETRIYEEFDVYQQLVDQAINRENKKLTALGIPVPEVISDISYKLMRISS